ncbi:cilia- and flagella-associated protein 157-like [Salarias fasciatus]|uniref:cilia- and flagella-associated protein 157-like n=1 Tax=Salarias fasciatus TaxID=181472 RepID=UPI001176C90D|nr:cilia- and flagella-associated protein 157-like [Salarias fasciatus]
MPKKKEKKPGEKEKEQEKEDEKKKTERKTSPGEEPGPDRAERDLLLIQITHLSEQLDSCQRRCDDLWQQNQALACQRGALEEEKRDLAAYLKRLLLQKEAEAEQLLERLQDQSRAAQRDGDDLRRQQDLLTQDMQRRVDALRSENRSLAETLAGLQQFQEQREELMGRVESMEKQLASQKVEHRDDVHSVEMKALMEKRRLERQLELHMTAMAAEVQQQVEQKVPESTRLALQENLEVKERLGRLSQHVQVLTEENAALRDGRRRLSVDLEVLEQMLSETTRTSCIRKKVVEQLTEKCRQLQAEQEVWKQQTEQVQSRRAELQAETEELRREQASLTEQRRADGDRMRRLEAELEEARGRSFRMKSVTEEAALGLQHALTAPPGPDCSPDSLLGWKQLMLKLLEVLLRRLRSTAEDSQPAVARAAGELLLHSTTKHEETAPQRGSGLSKTRTRTSMKTGTGTSMAQPGLVRNTKP